MPPLKQSLTTKCLTPLWSVAIVLASLQPSYADHPPNSIDRAVIKCLHSKRELAPLCSDETFLRRVYLDLTGTLPSLKDTTQFLKNKSSNKRSLLVDRLLASQDFSDLQTMRWCDRLKVKSEFPVKLWPNAVQAYAKFIHQSMEQDLPYDQFMQSLICSSGSNFRQPQVNFYRSVKPREAQAYASFIVDCFLGQDFKQWPVQKQSDLNAFFQNIKFKSTKEWKEEIVYCDLPVEPSLGEAASTNINVVKSSTEHSTSSAAQIQDKTPVMTLSKQNAYTLPNGQTNELNPYGDPRVLLAQWLSSNTNKASSQHAVHRIWQELMGSKLSFNIARDEHADETTEQPVLVACTNILLKNQWRLKSVFKAIVLSHTYQQSYQPQVSDPYHYHSRRLDAEVLIDLIHDRFNGRELLHSKIPEPFTYIPHWQKRVNISDGSISSRFLELYGRPSRDTGKENERMREYKAEQALYLLNAKPVLDIIQRSPLVKRASRLKKDEERWNHLYLVLLQRQPKAKEIQQLREYAKLNSKKRHERVQDICWALLNSKEFLYHH